MTGAQRTNTDATAEYLAGMKYQRQLDEVVIESLKAEIDRLRCTCRPDLFNKDCEVHGLEVRRARRE